MNREFVYEGSCQALVTSLGIFIGTVLLCLPVLEQPTSSTMPLQPCLRSLRSVFGYFGFTRTVTYLGQFGASSVKGLQLFHLPGTFDAISTSRPDPDLFTPWLPMTTVSGLASHSSLPKASILVWCSHCERSLNIEVVDCTKNACCTDSRLPQYAACPVACRQTELCSRAWSLLVFSNYL